MTEANILYETNNMYLYQTETRLEVRLHGNTHSVVVGCPKTIDAAKKFMDNAEKHINNLRAMYLLQ